MSRPSALTLLIVLVLQAGCSGSSHGDSRPRARPKIPAAALGIGGAAYADFRGTIKPGADICDDVTDINSCMNRYDVIVERRGDKFYLLFLPSMTDGSVIKGGGMAYLIDGKGKIVERTIQK